MPKVKPKKGEVVLCKGLTQRKNKCKKPTVENGFCESHKDQFENPVGTVKCEGLKSTRKPCNRYAKHTGTKENKNQGNYCDAHEDWLDFTEKQIQKIKADPEKKACSNCNHFHFDEGNTCDKCREKSKQYVKKPRKEPIPLCKGIPENDCNGSCESQSRFSGFCYHHKYQLEFTEDDIKNILNGSVLACKIKKCKRYHPNGECDKQENEKPKKKEKVKCRGRMVTDIDRKATIKYTTKPCFYEKIVENGYCKYHTYQQYFTKHQVEQMIKNELNLCNGCTKLLIDGNVRCKPCIERTDKSNAKKKKSKDKVKKCKGLTGIGEPCTRNRIDDTKYCKRHERFASYTNEQLENTKKCRGCKQMHYMGRFKSCDNCRGRKKVKETKKKITSCRVCHEPSAYFGLCFNHVHLYKAEADNFPCKYFTHGCKNTVNEESDLCSKCQVSDLIGPSCKMCLKSPNKNNYCKDHELYFEEEMLRFNDQKFCSIKRNCMKIIEINKEMCRDCNDYFEKINENNKQSCKQCDRKELKNGYCGKHQKYYIKDCIDEKGHKLCSNFEKRGCTRIATSHQRCDKCREKERKSDKKRRGKGKEKISEEDNKKICSGSCGKVYDIDEFLRNGKEYKTCSKCHEQNKKADKKRGKRKRDWAGELARNPERKKKKDEWKEMNPEKQIQYQDTQNEKRRNDPNYKEKARKRSAKFRKENPDKMKKQNEKKKLNPHSRFLSQQNRAMKQGIHWEITEEYFKKVTSNPCFYCNKKQTEYAFGLDRLDSSKDYAKDNCVSCCKICNAIKFTMDPTIFLHKIEHILHHQDEINDGDYHWDSCLNKIKKTSYAMYKKKAIEERGKGWSINEDEYNKIISKKCYICNKENVNNEHYNSIDRFCNEIGYEIDNCRPCCGQCNVMKGKLKYDEFIKQLKLIHKHKSRILNDVRIITDGCDFYNVTPLERFDLRKKYNLGEEGLKKYNNAKMKKSRLKTNGRSHIRHKRKKLTKEEFNAKNAERQAKNRRRKKEKYGEDSKKIDTLEKAIYRHKKSITKYEKSVVETNKMLKEHKSNKTKCERLKKDLDDHTSNLNKHKKCVEDKTKERQLLIDKHSNNKKQS